MSKFSQSQKVFELLKQSPLKKFKAREIAEGVINLFPEDYVEKRQNPRFQTDEDFINQVFAEIGAIKNNILKVSPFIHVQDKPRPRVFWYDPNLQAEHTESIGGWGRTRAPTMTSRPFCIVPANWPCRCWVRASRP